MLILHMSLPHLILTAFVHATPYATLQTERLRTWLLEIFVHNAYQLTVVAYFNGRLEQCTDLIDVFKNKATLGDKARYLNGR